MMSDPGEVSISSRQSPSPRPDWLARTDATSKTGCAIAAEMNNTPATILDIMQSMTARKAEYYRGVLYWLCSRK
jgi:Mg2+ and Co2+ transporter CorA